MSWLGLRHKGVEPLYPDEWNKVVDGLDFLYGYAQDLKLDLQSLDSKVEAYYLDCKSEINDVKNDVEKFYLELTKQHGELQSKINQYYLEIKSELGDIKTKSDTINTKIDTLSSDIEKYYLEVKTQLGNIESKSDTISSKVDGLSSDVKKYYLDIKSQLGDLKSEVDPISDYVREIYLMKLTKLLAYVVNKYVPEGVDVFDSDVIVDRSGRVRFKLWLALAGYVATKWTPAGLTEAIIGYLNAKDMIPSEAWHEFDFTVMKDDKINVRVYPSQNVTIFIYGLGEA